MIPLTDSMLRLGARLYAALTAEDARLGREMPNGPYPFLLSPFPRLAHWEQRRYCAAATAAIEAPTIPAAAEAAFREWTERGPFRWDWGPAMPFGTDGWITAARALRESGR